MANEYKILIGFEWNITPVGIWAYSPYISKKLNELNVWNINMLFITLYVSHKAQY